MSITVTERQLDEKHRITVPANFASNLKEGGKVIIVSYEDQAVIITQDKRVADELFAQLRQNEVKRKMGALDEWENLIDKAGLSKLTARNIDRAVEKAIRRPKKL